MAPRFTLTPSFLASYAHRRPGFGFNGLGEMAYLRAYARPVGASGHCEQWRDTVSRVVTGTFRMQEAWAAQQNLPWDAHHAQDRAQDMFARMFDMKFLPPGRGLWAMGSPITEERRLHAALNNCAFVSTAGVRSRGEGAKPFCFLFDAAMLGVGVGFDVQGAGAAVHRPASPPPGAAPVPVPDSREGWARSLQLLLDAYLLPNHALPRFDYSGIRPAGTPLRAFGGFAAGPDVLRELHEAVQGVLAPLAGGHLTSAAIVDVMNLVGRCVVAGNVRRTAEIAFGDPADDAFLDLKNYRVNPHRAAFGWTSNNSVFAEVGMDYSAVCRRVADNGEPGLAWLANMRAYGRMGDPPTFADHRAAGGNPCLEQTLESYEMCCLVETFPARAEGLHDFLDTLRVALEYAKTVTLGHTHWPDTNAVMLRNRRIGCSLSGVAQFVAQRGMGGLVEWCHAGYACLRAADALLSERLAVPRSVKLTSVKPSGTVSLLAGATPGMHFPEARYYTRRMRVAAGSPAAAALVRAGYAVEPDVVDPQRTLVAEFPVDAGEGVRTLDQVSVWEQFSLAATLQAVWADNQVSCTATFDPATEAAQLPVVLAHFDRQLKGISLLPRARTSPGSPTPYPQMPYEALTEAAYRAAVARLRPLDTSALTGAGQMPDMFCDAAGGACELPAAPTANRQPAKI